MTQVDWELSEVAVDFAGYWRWQWLTISGVEAAGVEVEVHDTGVKKAMGRQHFINSFLVILTVLSAAEVRGEDRRIEGTFNHPTDRDRGAAGMPLIRPLESAEYATAAGGILTDAQRRNARRISNAVSRQTTNLPSARRLSDYIWAWGQFLDHDLSLSSTSAGATVNGAAPIAVTESADPLRPNPINMTRSNFTTVGGVREQINEVTSWIDGSQIYGSSMSRALALRTNGGTGAKLLTSPNNLLPFNTTGLPNANNGPTPATQLFVAGDIRANENLLLTALQTVFMREHNRLVDRIAAVHPSLNAEQQYRAARSIVGAELQIITYKEFLPALLGPNAPKVEDYAYDPNVNGSIANAFSTAAYRFGHSAISSNLQLSDSSGASVGTLALANASFNPNMITNNPALIDQMLMGASRQVSQEVDLRVVDAIRDVSFGPPGAGGTDLAAIDIQRGRDHGIPDYNELRGAYGLPTLTNFNQITTNAAAAQRLASVYLDNINNIDAFVGGLAEDHLPGSSLGAMNTAIIVDQFVRSRDGDRLFYLNDAARLYTNGVLRPEIAAVINLNTITLADIIMANTGLTSLSQNLFFVPAGATPVPEPAAIVLATVAGLALLRTRFRTASRPKK